jgi:hypothetical protein
MVLILLPDIAQMTVLFICPEFHKWNYFCKHMTELFNSRKATSNLKEYTLANALGCHIQDLMEI